MSTCISKHGEYGSHEPGDWCPRCGAFNEDAIVAERDQLRDTLRAVEELHSGLMCDCFTNGRLVTPDDPQPTSNPYLDADGPIRATLRGSDGA